MPGQRQQVRQKIIMRRARTAMHDQQRRAAAQHLVINHHSIRIDEAFLQGINIRRRGAVDSSGLVSLSAGSYKKAERADKNETAAKSRIVHGPAIVICRTPQEQMPEASELHSDSHFGPAFTV